MSTSETAQISFGAFSSSYDDTDLLACDECPMTAYHLDGIGCPFCFGQQSILSAVSTLDNCFAMPMPMPMPHLQLDPSFGGLQTGDADAAQFDDLKRQTTEARPETKVTLETAQAEDTSGAATASSFWSKTLPALHQTHGQEAAMDDPKEGSKPGPMYRGEASSSRRRAPSDSRRRRETSEARRRKACLRCRVQKIRCDVNENETEGPCLACMSFSKVSKKTLHHVACFRKKLTDVTLYRKEGWNLTKRWTGTEMKDVGDRVNSDVRYIQITFGICATPLPVTVVRFQPAEGDVVAQFWTVREGERGEEVKHQKDLEPYCLVDVRVTAALFERYIVDNAIPTIIKVFTPPKILENTFVGKNVVGRTYIMAVNYYDHLDDEIQTPAGKVANPQKKLLRSLFILWLALRHTTDLAYICGDDTLGMSPEVKDDTYPQFGHVSVPRMLIAQLDGINHNRLLFKYGHEVLRDLESCMFRNQAGHWWTIYLCTFILLHEATWLSADQYRHARNNYGAKIRYSIPSFVKELQDGCINILFHWHYYNCYPWPNPDAPWERHNQYLSTLTSEEHDLVMETFTNPRIQDHLAMWKRSKEQKETAEQGPSSSRVQQYPQAVFDWDHPLYWVAQMFEERWQPHATYQPESAD
ncbi:hypothetical protein E4U53_007511 [Claviceps sorghi]|nr:hypothetical protein E4U53_007511 [Claviceps sorghi]